VELRVGLVYDPVYLEHDTGVHVENSERLTKTISLLEETDIICKLTLIPPRPASTEELALVHAMEYIEQIKKLSGSGGGRLDYDTVTSPGSYRAAVMAAGGLITATEAVLNKQVGYSFALVRPPGHHATCWQGKGFCLFNNIAIAAKYVLANYDINRILIVDFDVHHGNGTQDAFYTDPNVLYFSTHEYPLYPGTGHLDETGAREGTGFNINVPMVAGWGDNEYQAIYEDVLAPVALKYQPQLIIVSAGYDAHWADSLALMKLSVSGFARITEIIKTLADNLCPGNLVFTLEGGYNLQALSYSIAATLNILLGNNDFDDPLGKQESNVRFEDFDKFLKMIREKNRL
jgi:acetoin utilization deacetylase AcuC-like enzyme